MKTVGSSVEQQVEKQKEAVYSSSKWTGKIGEGSHTPVICSNFDSHSSHCDVVKVCIAIDLFYNCLEYYKDQK